MRGRKLREGAEGVGMAGQLCGLLDGAVDARVAVGRRPLLPRARRQRRLWRGGRGEGCSRGKKLLRSCCGAVVSCELAQRLAGVGLRSVAVRPPLHLGCISVTSRACSADASSPWKTTAASWELERTAATRSTRASSQAPVARGGREGSEEAPAGRASQWTGRCGEGGVEVCTEGEDSMAVGGSGKPPSP